MKGLIAGTVGFCVGMALLVAFASSNGRTDDPLGVAVSPQTLILGFDQGGNIKVHTAIPLRSVDRSSVTLNGIPAGGIGADSLGHMVAIFSEDAVKAIVQPPSAVLTLEGLYNDGESFSGSDTVQVIEDPS